MNYHEEIRPKEASITLYGLESLKRKKANEQTAGSRLSGGPAFWHTRFHGKESSPVEAICELGLERLEAVCSLWIVELPQDVPSSIAG